MAFNQIAIDLEVFKALEARRQSFEEPHNTILRRVLGIEGTPPINRPPDRERVLRASGTYEVSVLGETIRAKSLREALSAGLLKIEAAKPGFLEALTKRPTTRGRRIVARRPEEIYPNKPQLEQHAARLNADWYFDTNISRRACERYLALAALVANVETPVLT